MAKRKKSRGADMAAPMPTSGSRRMHVGIDSAENGFVVRVSGDSGGKNPTYHEKTMVATSPNHALRVAASHLRGGVKKAHGKKGGKKKFAAKKM
jgi:hypothetical protein